MYNQPHNTIMNIEYNFNGTQIWLDRIEQTDEGVSFFGFSIFLTNGKGYSFPMGKISQEFIDANSELSNEERARTFFEILALSYEARERKDIEGLNEQYAQLELEPISHL